MIIHRKVSREKLLRCLPLRFADQLASGIPEPITAVVLPDQVVTGRKARKALDKVGPDFGGSLVFAARTFSVEALSIITSIGGFTLRTSSDANMWTDQTYEEIKTLIGTHVKTPSLR